MTPEEYVVQHEGEIQEAARKFAEQWGPTISMIVAGPGEQLASAALKDLLQAAWQQGFGFGWDAALEDWNVAENDE